MNISIKVSSEFGLVIRKASLVEKKIDRQIIIKAFEMEEPLDECNELISFGPHFGLDHAEARGKILQQLGLAYIDDFFYFYGDFPNWVEFSVRLKK